MNEIRTSLSSIFETINGPDEATERYLTLKRSFDVVVSAIALAVLSPFFLLLIVLIRLDSKGPALFKQVRVGYRGRNFRMIKFRSMVADAEEKRIHLECLNEAAGPMFKIRRDPRVTRIGRLIRKTSIDELPQLFNVLKGDMSIVGPRPPIPREVVRYEAWHHERLSVVPGLTGLWQISGRNDLDFEDMVRLDLKYIRERNFRLDLKIILKTIPVLFGDPGAS